MITQIYLTPESHSESELTENGLNIEMSRPDSDNEPIEFKLLDDADKHILTFSLTRDELKLAIRKMEMT